MNWDTLSQAADLVEAFVIVISLIYFAVQMRQNTKAVKTSAAQAQVDGYNTIVSNVVQSKDAASAWYRGLKDADKLKPEEGVQFFAQCGLYFRLIETSFFQANAHALEPGLWHGLVNLNRTILAQKGIHQFLDLRGHCYSPEFQRWLKEEMKLAGGAPYPALIKSGN